jgi:hypothetical protein
MSNRTCRQADVWMAAVDAGQLDEANRIRLLDHLESCAPCARRARGIASLVALLKDEAVELRSDRLQHVWSRVLASSASPSARTLFAARRRAWLLPLGATAVALAAAAAGVFFSLRATRNVRSPLTAATQPMGPGRRLPWRTVILSRVLVNDATPARAGGEVGPGDRLTVSSGGSALLISPAEVIILRGDTQISFSTASMIELERGSLAVRTRQGPAPQEIAIQAGPVRVRPVGTTFSVERASAAPVRIAVASGRVEVSSSGARATLPSGQMLDWGGRPRAIDIQAQRKLARELGLAMDLASRLATRSASHLRVSGPRGNPIQVDGLLVGEGQATLLLPPGRHEVTLEAASGGTTSRMVELRAGASRDLDLDHETSARWPGFPPGGAASARQAEAEIRVVEELLSRGQASQARRTAIRLLGLPQTQGHEPSLHTLIAESHMHERRYDAARDAYLQLWRRYSGTTLGADGLYMAGSLELEQLHQERAARKRFERYLAAYPRGRQREGAFYLLCQSLLRTGERQLALDVASRYRSEFPRGRFLQELQGAR